VTCTCADARLEVESQDMCTLCALKAEKNQHPSRRGVCDGRKNLLDDLVDVRAPHSACLARCLLSCSLPEHSGIRACVHLHILSGLLSSWFVSAREDSEYSRSGPSYNRPDGEHKPYKRKVKRALAESRLICDIRVFALAAMFSTKRYVGLISPCFTLAPFMLEHAS
jgi:hypothetical protein